MQSSDDDVDTISKERMEQVLSLYDVPQEAAKSILRKIEGPVTEAKFRDIMVEFLKNAIFEQENEMEKLKKLFKEADMDNSGFLSMEEIYNLLTLNLGIEN